MKKCCHCKELKEVSEFIKDKTTSDGLYPKCKSCIKEYTSKNKDTINKRQAIYHAANRSVLIEKMKLYRLENLDRCKENQRLYRIINADKCKRNDKEHYVSNRSHILKQKKIHYIENKAAILKQKKNYVAARPLLATMIKSRRLCSYLLKPLILLRDNNQCCLCKASDKLILHHIVPVKLDSSKLAEHTNLVILCTSCHLYEAHSGNYTLLNQEIQDTLIKYVEMLHE